jgi:hypothetical protein
MVYYLGARSEIVPTPKSCRFEHFLDPDAFAAGLELHSEAAYAFSGDTGQEDVGSQRVRCDDFGVSEAFEISTPMPDFGFPVCDPAIASVCVHQGGRKHSRRTKRHVLCCAPLSELARSPISSGSQ